MSHRDKAAPALAVNRNEDIEELAGMADVPPPLPPPTIADIRGINRDYRAIFGRRPDLLRPQRFTEKIQWRKLFDLNPIYGILSDKIAARDFIADRVGKELLPPLLWTGGNAEDIPFDELEPPYILKCNHGSSFNVTVQNRATLNVERAKEKLRSCLAINYGLKLREPGYVPIRPRLLAERLMMEPDGTPPREFKFFVFDGRVRAIETITVDLTCSRARSATIYDRNWRNLRWRTDVALHQGEFAPPRRLDEFFSIAERLASGFDHLRVDMYEWNGRPKVGELTPYSFSGLTRFEPDEADLILGDWWRLRRPVRRALGSFLLR